MQIHIHVVEDGSDFESMATPTLPFLRMQRIHSGMLHEFWRMDLRLLSVYTTLAKSLAKTTKENAHALLKEQDMNQLSSLRLFRAVQLRSNVLVLADGSFDAR